MRAEWRDVVSRAEMPIVIISHNQLTYLRDLLGWLASSGHQRIIILDNASTFEPLVDFLDSCPYEVIRLESNLGHTSPWDSDLAFSFEGPFVVTDPDVYPDPECPPDAVDFFQELLLRHRAFDKAGFGLLVDDIPESYPHRAMVRRWEAPFWERTVEPGVFTAHIDTTFAVHRPGTPYKKTEALRTGPPYVARHRPWYRDPSVLDEETAHFVRNRRDDVGYWNRIGLPAAARDHREGQGW